jgi:hypothetical protein
MAKKIQKPFFPILLSLVLYTCGTTKTGGIFGRVKSADTLKPIPQTSILLTGTDRFTTTDSFGVFYIAEIVPGVHTAVVSAPGFQETTVKGIRVSPDSISIIVDVCLKPQRRFTKPSLRKWRGAIIGEVDTQKRVSISGRVIDGDSSQPLFKAGVVVKGTSWGERTDTLGSYLISGILSGKYTVIASRGDFHRTIVRNVRVAPDSISIVNFRLWPIAIPERPLPTEWEGVVITGQ